MNSSPRSFFASNLRGLSQVIFWPFVRLVVVLALAALLFFVVSPILVWKVRREALAVRPRGKPSLEALATLYERHEPNLSARRLERLAVPLGIRLAPKSAAGRPSPTQKAIAEEVELKNETRRFLDGFIDRADDEIPEVSAEIRSFLGRHREEILVVRQHLLTQQLPVWELDPTDIDGPLPNFLGLMTIARLLAAQAILDHRSGCLPEVELSLSAFWRLDESMLERPELIGLLIYRANDSLLHRLVRIFPGLSPRWPERLAGFDPAARAVTALRWEAPIIVRHLLSDPNRADNWLTRTALSSMRPYFDICGWDHARRMELLAARHLSLNYCDLTPESVENLWQSRAPRWNIVSRVAWPELSSATARLLRRRLDQELTRLVAEVRAGSVPLGTIPSRACPNNVWIVRGASSEGASSIELAQRVFDPVKKQLPLELSLRFVFRSFARRAPPRG